MAPTGPDSEARIAVTVIPSLVSAQTSLLYTVRADGSDPQLLFPGTSHRRGAAWAPDRSQLVFTYDSTGNASEAEIRIVNANGAQERTILGPGWYSDPAWSPQGSSIVLVHHEEDGTDQLVTISPTGADLATIAYRVASDADPAWSPDGQRLAFVSNCLAQGCNRFVSDLWTMNADGSEPRQLTAGVGIDDDASAPEWSPDGEWIVFSMTRSNRRDIYRIRPTGADLESLTSATLGVSYHSPTYSPDGRSLAYVQ